MEQNFWYMLWTYVFGLFVCGVFVRSYDKNTATELKEQKEDYEKKIELLRKSYHKDLLKLRFELSNPPKYAVGDKLGDFFLILWVGIGEEQIENGFLPIYYNRYEVFNTKQKTKTFIAEKTLLELLKKGKA